MLQCVAAWSFQVFWSTAHCTFHHFSETPGWVTKISTDITPLKSRQLTSTLFIQYCSCYDSFWSIGPLWPKLDNFSEIQVKSVVSMVQCCNSLPARARAPLCFRSRLAHNPLGKGAAVVPPGRWERILLVKFGILFSQPRSPTLYQLHHFSSKWLWRPLGHSVWTQCPKLNSLSPNGWGQGPWRRRTRWALEVCPWRDWNW